MARILLADIPPSLRRLERILSGRHEFTAVSTLNDALNALRAERFDGVVCGMHFDGCRMIDLLREVRREEEFSEVPFVCWQNDESELPDTLMQSTRTAATVLGACLYLTHEEVSVMSDAELRTALESCMLPCDAAARI